MSIAEKRNEPVPYNPTVVENYLEEALRLCGYALSPRQEISSGALTGFLRKAGTGPGKNIEATVEYVMLHIFEDSRAKCDRAPSSERCLTTILDSYLGQAISIASVESVEFHIPVLNFDALVQVIDGKTEIRINQRNFDRCFWKNFGMFPHDARLAGYIQDEVLNYRVVSPVIKRLCEKRRRNWIMTYPTADIIDGIREYIGMFLFDFEVINLTERHPQSLVKRC